ncbi:hypothetical protein DMN91_008576, partial [Ooceraea biroi]
FYNKRNIRE